MVVPEPPDGPEAAWVGGGGGNTMALTAVLGKVWSLPTFLLFIPITTFFPTLTTNYFENSLSSA